MSTSVPPRDSGAPTGSPSSLTASSLLSDESALKRVFDEQYSGYIASARRQLGDAQSHAPRIVECAFVDAWKARESITTNDELRTFLDQGVQHGVSRALSRRAAAHRFGTHGGRDEVAVAQHNAGSSEADAERSWAEVTRAIHSTGPSAAAHAAAVSASRHEAAEHMKVVARRAPWKVPLAIAVIALAITGGAMAYLDRLGADEAALSSVGSAALQPVAASTAGQIGSFTLGDGSKVRIGPDTKVFVPDGFPTKIRAVRVDGTAQIEVAANQTLPMRVVMKKAQVIATGTSFTVYGYPDDSAFMVSVREGSVTVKSGKLSNTLTANQSVMVRGTTAEPLTDTQRAEAFGWVDGKMAATDRPLRDVVAQLTRWFNLDIKVPDLKLLDRKATVNVPLDSSRLAIAQVEKSANVKFGYEGETKVFRDAATTTNATTKKK